MAQMRGVLHDFPGPLLRPGLVEGLEGGEGAAGHPHRRLRRLNHPLYSRSVLHTGSGEPGGDREGEDGFNDGSIELDHHGPGQPELP